MSAVAGFINSKIVPFTGNQATKPFIGKAIHPKESNGRPVFMIAETGYVLTLEEFKMFVRAGIIDRPNRAPKPQQPMVTVQPSPTKAARSQNPVKAPGYTPPARAVNESRKQQAVAAQQQAAKAKAKKAEAVKASKSKQQAAAQTVQAVQAEPVAAAPRVEKQAASRAAAATVASMAQPSAVIPKETELEHTTAPLHGAMGDMTEIFETSQFLKEYTNPQFEFGEPKHHRMLEAGEKFREGMTGFFDKIGFSAKESIVNGLK